MASGTAGVQVLQCHQTGSVPAIRPSAHLGADVLARPHPCKRAQPWPRHSGKKPTKNRVGKATLLVDGPEAHRGIVNLQCGFVLHGRTAERVYATAQVSIRNQAFWARCPVPLSTPGHLRVKLARPSAAAVDATFGCRLVSQVLPRGSSHFFKYSSTRSFSKKIRCCVHYYYEANRAAAVDAMTEWRGACVAAGRASLRLRRRVHRPRERVRAARRRHPE